MQSVNKLILNLYGGAWRAAGPFLRRHKRLREGFEERLVPDTWPDAPAGQDESPSFASGNTLRIWLQAASGGEAWLVHSLVPALAEALSHLPHFSGHSLHVLCTTCTRQGREVLQKLHPDKRYPSVSLISRYFPLDSPTLMAKAMRLANPHLVVLLETELWPGLLATARSKGVPVLVLNARMTEKSLSGYRLLGSFFRSVAPERVLAISEPDAERFAGLFDIPDRVGVMPNIKFDRLEAAMPLDAPSCLRREAGFAADSLLAVLASVREEEENILLPVLQELKDVAFEGRPLALAIAPRHMHRVGAWQNRLDAAGIAWRLRSQCRNAGQGQCDLADSAPIMLWDSFGDLLSLYSMADAVFVGGSLAPLGGQNFLEPASLGLVPVVGPHISNFLWVGEDFFEQGLGLRVEQGGLAKVLREQLEQRNAALSAASGPEEREQVREAEAEKGRMRFKQWLTPHLGGSRRAAELVAATLKAVSK